ncbi:MAG: 2-oxo acid dehydrogenase subunit E2 [Candidatus Omnitrophica bacterium]|nr:2-oxo acid dehydrogenase subunit E2 [Candidatus Omnitrophota bacterium]
MLDFKLPEVGENITSGTVVGIMVTVGDSIKKDQDLLELETDKASLPVPAPCDGVIKEILISDGQEVQIGSVIMKIEESAAGGAPTAEKEKNEEANAQQTPSKPEEGSKPQAKTQEGSARQSQSASTTATNESIEPQLNVPAAPSIRRLARELGVAISNVPGTGPGGRITKQDVKDYVKSMMQSGGGTAGGAGLPSKPLPDFSKYGGITREKMNKIRQVTMDQMSLCWLTIPHVTQFDKADITDIEKLRKKYSTNDRKLTITPFLLKVMASALKTFPKFNASIDSANKEIIYKNYFNIGVAVDTERGLLVPVVRDVDKKSIFEIADELNEMAQRARDRKTGLDELQGGCMTLTNLGGIGGTAFTPIVNWPEVSILGVSRGGLEPRYENGHFIPRLMLPLSLSYDHRLIDGADAARFLRWICEAIEQPFMMELET